MKGQNNIAKVVLLFCVLMQVVALTPHHHHGDSEAVCLDYTHITSDDHCKDVCCGEHEHTEHPYTTCSASYNLVITQPELRENTVSECVLDLPDEQPADFFDIFAPQFSAVTITAGSGSGRSVPITSLRDYLAVARSPRAPDFFC